MDRHALLERFRTGFDDVVDSLAGITAEELDRRPPGSDWTARQVPTIWPTAKRPRTFACGG